MTSFKLVCSALCLLVVIKSGYSETPETSMRALKKVYSYCEDSDELMKCIKIQALKLTDRAIKLPNIKLLDGMAIVKKPEAEAQRSFNNEPSLSELELNKLSSNKIDEMLYSRAQKFMETHQLQMNVPRLMTSGTQESGRLVEEGRKKMKKYLGPFMAAMAIKGGILTMVYHSIAVVAGKALIIGKIALVISAIIGLKKLVTPEGHEKTTYEIVKHPHVQHSQTYSSSHGDFENHGEGQFHRSFGNSVKGDDMLMQDRAYRAYAPKN